LRCRAHRGFGSARREGIPLGFVNAGSVPLTVKVELFDALGAKLGDLSQPLRAFEYKQFDKTFERVTSVPIEDGYAVLTTSTSGGAFFAYASAVAGGEPIGSINSATGTRIVDRLLAWAGETSGTLLVVTHDQAVAGRMDRVLGTLDGRMQPRSPRAGQPQGAAASWEAQFCPW
jgi:hypothetical protein